MGRGQNSSPMCRLFINNKEQHNKTWTEKGFSTLLYKQVTKKCGQSNYNVFPLAIELYIQKTLQKYKE